MNAEAQPHAGEKLIRLLAFTLVLSSMSATMFNIVLPEMSREYDLSFSQVSWVSAVYMLLYAIGSALYGKLADVFKLKNLLTFGLVFFFAGSFVGLAAQAFWMVLLGRILQAAGASVIPATAMIIPVRYFPAERRGRALGISATGLAIGNAVGPVVSAAIAAVAHWRWLFAVPLLILFTLPLYRKYLNDEPSRPGRIDWIGSGLLAGAVALLLIAVTLGMRLPAAGSLLLLLLFIARIRTAAEPFVQPRLFRNGRYSLALALAALVSGIGFSLPFLTPKLLAEVHHLAPGWIGFAMVPAAAVSALLGRTGGKLADRKGNAFLFGIASASIMAGFALLSSWAGVSPLLVALFLILCNVGQMFLQLALSNTISRTLPKDQVGVGMGLLSMLNFLSGSVSMGLYGKIADVGARIPWNPLSANPDAYVFSNLYAALAVLHVGILLLYRRQFAEEAGAPRRPQGRPGREIEDSAH